MLNKKVFYNKEAIIKVTLFNSDISDNFTFKKKSIIEKLFKLDKKYIVDYLYRRYHELGSKYTIEEFTSEYQNYYISNNQVYHKPFVKIVFANNKTEKKYFESEEDAQKYVDNIINEKFMQYE